MVDNSPLLKHVEQAFGMVRADATFSVRPIFKAFQMLRRELTPTTRAQLIDLGAANQVYLEQPSNARRVTVVWNMTPQPLSLTLSTLGPTAQLMDRFGATRPATLESDNRLRLTLAPATANTVQDFPNTYFIGGEPSSSLNPFPARTHRCPRRIRAVPRSELPHRGLQTAESRFRLGSVARPSGATG